VLNMFRSIPCQVFQSKELCRAHVAKRYFAGYLEFELPRTALANDIQAKPGDAVKYAAFRRLRRTYPVLRRSKDPFWRVCSTGTKFVTGANHATVQIPYEDDSEGTRPCNGFAAHSSMLANNGPLNLN
jgi:hypothetical protein